MKKKISIALIIMGITLILLPSIGDFMIKIVSEKNVQYFEQLSVENLKGNQNHQGDFHFDGVRNIQPTSAFKGINDFDKNLILGQLEILSINLNLLVLKGVAESNLNVGAATMKENQVMGQRNYTLAGHYMKRKDALFGGLIDIKVGDIIRVTDKETIYEYQVYDTLVVPDTEVKLLSDERAIERGKPIISLMTCYYSSDTGKRFFAVGELVNEYPYHYF